MLQDKMGYDKCLTECHCRLHLEKYVTL